MNDQKNSPKRTTKLSETPIAKRFRFSPISEEKMEMEMEIDVDDSNLNNKDHLAFRFCPNNPNTPHSFKDQQNIDDDQISKKDPQPATNSFYLSILSSFLSSVQEATTTNLNFPTINKSPDNSHISQLKFDKKRLINKVTKFKANIKANQIGYRKRLNESKKQLREANEDLITQLTHSRNQLLSELDEWEKLCVEKLEGSSKIDEYNRYLNSLENELCCEEVDLDEIEKELSRKQCELGDYLRKCARIRFEPNEVDLEAGLLFCSGRKI